MENFMAVCTTLVMVVLLILAFMGVTFVTGGSIDKAVINDCNQQGWHNFGQTRIICSVETKKEPK